MCIKDREAFFNWLKDKYDVADIVCEIGMDMEEFIDNNADLLLRSEVLQSLYNEDMK